MDDVVAYGRVAISTPDEERGQNDFVDLVVFQRFEEGHVAGRAQRLHTNHAGTGRPAQVVLHP